MRTVSPNICTGYGYKKLENNLLQDSINPEGINYTKYSDVIFPHLTNKIDKKIIYLETEKFTHFIDKITFENNQCIYNSSICTIDYFLKINFNDLKYSYTIDFFNNINNCLNTQQYNRIFIPLNLRFENKTGHSNLIIIDKNEKTIYFFEPHGKVYGGEISEFIDIKYHIISIVKNIFNLNEYNVHNVFDACGPQEMQSYANTFIKSGGFCLSWSLLIIHLLLLNNKVSVNDIITFIMSHTSDKLNCYIQKYSTYVHYMPSFYCEKVNNSVNKTLYYNFKLTNEENCKINTIIIEHVKNHIYNNVDTIGIFVLFGKFPQYNDIYFKSINYYTKEKTDKEINTWLL